MVMRIASVGLEVKVAVGVKVGVGVGPGVWVGAGVLITPVDELSGILITLPTVNKEEGFAACKTATSALYR